MGIAYNDVIFLLGAGSSAEAGIPTSLQMIENLEGLINSNQTEGNTHWGEYRDLYNYLKSSILFSRGIEGDFDIYSNFNIEKLVNVLNELEKREKNALFPLIGSWNSKLLEVINYKFEKISEFKNLIIGKLKSWVTIDAYAKANYYENFYKYKRENNFPIRIFSLNYDLCIEKTCNKGFVERGFNLDLEERPWDWRKLEEFEISQADILLYKLHGSIDWKKLGNGGLTFSESPETIQALNLIFGTDYKFQYNDPYLYLAFQFRNYSLLAKLIICIGYGFNDDHINTILHQALQNKDHKILCITYFKDNTDFDKYCKKIHNDLSPQDENQIICENQKAKSFLENNLNIQKISSYFPENFEIKFQ